LRGDQWIGAPDLLPGLAKESLYQECPTGGIGVERRNAHQLEVRLECDAFRPRLSRSGDAGPDFDRCQSRYCQGTSRGGCNAPPDVFVAWLLFQKGLDNAGIEKIPHRLK
jgi:hypothetical protein